MDAVAGSGPVAEAADHSAIKMPPLGCAGMVLCPSVGQRWHESSQTGRYGSDYFSWQVASAS